MSWPSLFNTCAFLCYCDFYLLSLETMLLFTLLWSDRSSLLRLNTQEIVMIFAALFPDNSTQPGNLKRVFDFTVLKTSNCPDTFCLLAVLFQWQKYHSVWTYVTSLASVHVFQCRMAMNACHPEPAVCAAHVLPDLNHHECRAETSIRFFRRR